MLKVQDLVVKYSNNLVLDNLYFEAEKGEIIVIHGDNGSGKSTFLKSISGLVSPQAGSIIYEGLKINDVPTFLRVKMGIGMVSQQRNIFTNMTVFENLELGGYALAKTELDKGVDEAMGFFPVLREKKGEKAGTLSGGEQQILALARGLFLLKSRLFLLDEPIAGIAEKLLPTIAEKIQSISKENRCVIIVEHRTRYLVNLAHKKYLMKYGNITQELNYV